MPLPIIPIAGASLAAIALARALRRSLRPVRIDQRGEDALDDIDEGLGVARVAARAQTNASGRFRRTIRFGPDGAGVEIDVGWLARLRIRRVGGDA
ncbi:MAG: hypothetical protein N2Z62_13470 [Rhodobacteraceae bacterium]|nr:hypothetical protein [Paracoccaceae bacterium]